MAGAMLVVIASDQSTPRYYMLNPRFAYLGARRGRVLFRLSEKILDALKYFGLYR